MKARKKKKTISLIPPPGPVGDATSTCRRDTGGGSNTLRKLVVMCWGERSRAGRSADARKITYDSHDAASFPRNGKEKKEKDAKMLLSDGCCEGTSGDTWALESTQRSRPDPVVLNAPPDVSGCQLSLCEASCVFT